MKHSANIRIAIVGAGAAGLTAAETLKEKGYTDITLIEKTDEPGGKCRSIEYQGRSYELGAGVISETNHTVRALVKKFGIKIMPVEFDSSLFLDAHTGRVLTNMSWREKMVLAYECLFKYRKLALRYRNLAEPGLLQVDPDLCMPFTDWAKKHNLSQVVTEEFAKYFTGFGYGYLDEIPAAYVVKYYSWETVKAFIKQRIYMFPGGIQGLWKAVAKDHRVLYHTSIKNIERREHVTLTTETETLSFDTLILTAPLDSALKYLDAREEEQSLFSKILYCDYRTYACTITGFPKKTGYIPGNLHSSRTGHPVLWYERYADSNFYTFYILGDWKMSDEEALKNIESLVHGLGGAIERVETIARWKYFPHVSSKDMRQGYFDTLENLQGKNHTYYAGELLNFSTVDESASYAKKLVERFF